MSTKTFIITVTESREGGTTAERIHTKLLQGYGMYPPKGVSVRQVEPRHPIVYRDPYLSDQWLKEAEIRANNDWSLGFFRKGSRLIIKRLILEVRNLNRMVNR